MNVRTIPCNRITEIPNKNSSCAITPFRIGAVSSLMSGLTNEITNNDTRYKVQVA